MEIFLSGEILSITMFLTTLAMLLLGFPVAFTLAGVALVFAGIGYLGGVFRPLDLAALPSRYFGVMTNYVLVAVPLFVFMGVMLERSRIAEQLLHTMGLLFGRMRGGLGLSVILVGMLLAASTGIVGATVVTMGLLSLPAMLNNGYDKRLATGAICASGTLGQIIPPSIVLVLLGDILQGASAQARATLMAQGRFDVVLKPVNVLDLFAGALLPGLLLVGLYMAWIMIVALFRPSAAPAMTEQIDRGDLWRRVLRVLLPPAILILAVLGSILLGVAPPTEAAAIGAVGALLLAARNADGQAPLAIRMAGLGALMLVILRWNFDLNIWRDDATAQTWAAAGVALVATIALFWGVIVAMARTYRRGILTEVMRTTMNISGMVFIILLGASVFSLVFRSLGGEAIVHDVMHNLPGGPMGAVLAVMALMFVLGFFLDYIEIIFVVVPIVAPVLLTMGVDPVWLGVLISVNLQTSFLTPPFGFALFYLRGVAPVSVTTGDIYKGIIPFVLIQLLALGLLIMFPAIATWLPAML